MSDKWEKDAEIVKSGELPPIEWESEGSGFKCYQQAPDKMSYEQSGSHIILECMTIKPTEKDDNDKG